LVDNACLNIKGGQETVSHTKLAATESLRIKFYRSIKKAASKEFSGSEKLENANLPFERNYFDTDIFLGFLPFLNFAELNKNELISDLIENCLIRSVVENCCYTGCYFC
jgi:hypothetical protein